LNQLRGTTSSAKLRSMPVHARSFERRGARGRIQRAFDYILRPSTTKFQKLSQFHSISFRSVYYMLEQRQQSDFAA